MQTTLITLSGLFLVSSLFILMSHRSKYQKFLDGLKIYQNVKVYNKGQNRISTYCVEQINREDETVVLSDGKTYSFNDLLY